MRPPSRDLGSGRERLVLAIAIASALLLATAAFVTVGDPGVAGRAALVETAGRVADAVVLEWQRILRDPASFAKPADGWITWSPKERPVARPVAADAAPRHDRAPDAWSALFGEARRLERNATAALAVVIELLAKELEPGRRAEARLFAIQLAIATDDAELAREQLQLAMRELDPTMARGDVAYVLLCALAAEPALDPDARRSLGASLAETWTRGELALPRLAYEHEDESERTADPLPRVLLDARSEALRERLIAFSGDPAVERRLGRDRERSLASVFRAELARIEGELDASAPTSGWAPLPARPEDESWRARPLDGGVFAWRATEDGRVTGGCFAHASLAEALRAIDVTPVQFQLAFDGEQAGHVVRERTALPGSRFGFRVGHDDPEAFVRRQGKRHVVLRAALFVLALFIGGMGIGTARALRRERLLADLRSAFVANVSHELRTPLASILLMAENLESGRATGAETVARYHGSIRREAVRLRRLVDDVLDFSRLERGRPFELRREETVARTWTSELADDARSWAGEARVVLAIDVGVVPGSIDVDREALRRAVFNLLDNARRHAGASAVELAIRAEPGALVLSVADHGPGVPVAQREAIFEPFVRLAEGADRPAGVGLGLPIVREIVRGHGGTVAMRARGEGPGAVFEIRIPSLASEAVA